MEITTNGKSNYLIEGETQREKSALYDLASVDSVYDVSRVFSQDGSGDYYAIVEAGSLPTFLKLLSEETFVESGEIIPEEDGMEVLSNGVFCGDGLVAADIYPLTVLYLHGYVEEPSYHSASDVYMANVTVKGVENVDR